MALTKQSTMLSYTEALGKILATTTTLAEEELALERLLNRYLSRAIQVQFDLPRFDNSAVDGFGVLLDDVSNASEANPARLHLKETIHAGSQGDATIKRGEAIKILTGARVPPSVEAVVMQEFCSVENGRLIVGTHAQPGENIRRQGGEFRQGDEVLPAGMRINPAVLGLIASFGQTRFFARRQPKIAIVVTGDELVKPGKPLLQGQIYESNSYALSAAVRSLGLPECIVMHTRDDRAATANVFKEALEEADIVISAGGVSVGEHDFVKVALEEDLGVQTVFWRIAIKPGKPVYFGYIDRQSRKLVFGLPGNPVSALVTFNLFVKPAIKKMQGAAIVVEDTWRAHAQNEIKKKPGRMDFVRGRLSCSETAELSVLPTRGQDSHMLSGLARANCLIHFEAEDDLISAGEIVNIQPLDWLT